MVGYAFFNFIIFYMFFSRLTSLINRKETGIIYIVFGTACVIIGSILSWSIRLELAVPGSYFVWVEYGPHSTTLVTPHAILMIFYVVMSIFIAGFGSWAVPLLVGAQDMAFPRLYAMVFFYLAQFADSAVLYLIFCVCVFNVRLCLLLFIFKTHYPDRPLKLKNIPPRGCGSMFRSTRILAKPSNDRPQKPVKKSVRTCVKLVLDKVCMFMHTKISQPLKRVWARLVCYHRKLKDILKGPIDWIRANPAMVGTVFLYVVHSTAALIFHAQKWMFWIGLPPLPQWWYIYLVTKIILLWIYLFATRWKGFYIFAGYKIREYKVGALLTPEFWFFLLNINLHFPHTFFIEPHYAQLIFIVTWSAALWGWLAQLKILNTFFGNVLVFLMFCVFMTWAAYHAPLLINQMAYYYFDYMGTWWRPGYFHSPGLHGPVEFCHPEYMCGW